VFEHLLPVAGEEFGIDHRWFDIVFTQEIGEHIFAFELGKFSEVAIAQLEASQPAPCACRPQTDSAGHAIPGAIVLCDACASQLVVTRGAEEWANKIIGNFTHKSSTPGLEALATDPQYIAAIIQQAMDGAAELTASKSARTCQPSRQKHFTKNGCLPLHRAPSTDGANSQSSRHGRGFS
jgi:hypothetical protein